MITADKLIKRIEEFKKSEIRDDSMFVKNCERINDRKIKVFLGLSDYPDGSNLTSKIGLYSNIGRVAFFSNKVKSDLFFVVAILMGSMKESLDLVQHINALTSISWDDVVDYLAISENIYFVNLQDVNFKYFNAALGQANAVYLLFSTDKRYVRQVKSFSSYSDHAPIIHPSSQNLNNHTEFWINQYVTCNFTGPINNSKLQYADFQLF